MKHLLLFCLLAVPFFSLAQKTEFLDKDHKPVPDKAQAKYYRETLMADSVAGTVKTYLLDGRITSEDQYGHVKKFVKNGVSRTWFEDNGQLKFDLHYQAGKLHGPVRSYYPNGQLKRDDVYNVGELEKGRCFTQTGQDTAFYLFEVMPEFPGGQNEMIRFISTNVRYPKKARKNDIQGQVMASFVVQTDGSIADIEIIKSVHEDLDQEVTRMIGTMPRWQPGKMDGKKVRVRFHLPVRFNLM